MSRHPILRRRVALPGDFIVLLLLSLLEIAPATHAQDAVRPSLAGEATSEARQQDISRIPYNLLIGPVRFRVSTTLGVEYNDNVNYADVGKQADWIITPNINIDAV